MFWESFDTFFFGGGEGSEVGSSIAMFQAKS